MSAAISPEGEVDYRSHRIGTPPALETHLRYAPAGPLRHAAPGSLEFFLVERYLLFTRGRRNGLLAGQVAHPPYEIADARVAEWDDHIVSIGPPGLSPPARPFDHALYAPGVDVDVFPLRPVP